jgi:hypothetical protein
METYRNSFFERHILHIIFSCGNFCSLVLAEAKITDLTELKSEWIG